MYSERTTGDFQFFIANVRSYYFVLCYLSLLALVFEIIHFIQNIFARIPLKFRCTIIVIIYLNSLLFPLTKEIWTKLEIKLADNEWGGSEGRRIQVL